MKRFTFYGCSDACRLTRIPAVHFWSTPVHMPIFAPSVCPYMPRTFSQAHPYVGKLRPRYSYVRARCRIDVLCIYVCTYVATVCTSPQVQKCQLCVRGCSQQFKCCSFDPVASFLPSSSCWESQSLFQCATEPILDQFQRCSVRVFILQVEVCS